MKKVALLTWYNHDNYGTILQSIASIEIIKELGYEVTPIYYESNSIKKVLTEKITDSTKIKQYLKTKLMSINNKSIDNSERKLKFDEFKKKNYDFHVAQTSSELFLLNQQFDAFVVGSDQIWSPINFNPKFFLDFVTNNEKKISFAPSFGVSSIEDKLIKNQVKNLLEEFNHISVREEQGGKIISELVSKDYYVSLDPTLIVDENVWTKHTAENEIKEKYILTYFLGNNNKHWKSVIDFAKEKSLKVVTIPIHNTDSKRNTTCRQGVGPSQFLSLIKNAEYVCTDSFHGAIFSIIFKTKFVIYKRFSDSNKGSQNSRIYNLCQKLDLDSRIYQGSNEVFLKQVDWEVITSKLKTFQTNAKTFLRNSLNKAVNSKSIASVKSVGITNTCSGCSACLKTCPTSAISIELNDQGFYQSKVNKNKCIDCNNCRKVCPFYSLSSNENFNNVRNELFASKSQDKNTLQKTTSGGIAFELGKYFLDNGYTIFGCTYDNELKKAKHIEITPSDKDQLWMLSGSKYLQSNFEAVYEKIETSQKAAIFGTPCQIAGLDNFLRNKKIRDNYILIDLICHGVPSYLLWDKYLSEFENKNKVNEPIDVTFRSKYKGWSNIHINLRTEKKNKYFSQNKDMFYTYFTLQIPYMSSCYECNFRNKSHADIRLGDFWGEKSANDKKLGLSMVVTNSVAGLNCINSLKDKKVISLEKHNIEDYTKVQFPFNHLKPPYYDDVINDLKDEKITLSKIAKKNFKHQFYSRKINNILIKTKLK